MADWHVFVYGIPSALGVLVFLKVVANRIAAIDAGAALAAAKAESEQAECGDDAR